MIMLPPGTVCVVYLGQLPLFGDIIIKSALVVKSETPVRPRCRIIWYDVHMFVGLIVHCI